MAEIVAGFGVPHNPGGPEMVERDGPQSELAVLYGAVAEHVAAAEPDVIVVFSSDHMNTFFLDNLPMLSVGITDRSAGPNDGTRMPRYDVAVHEGLAQHVRTHGLQQEFDLGVTQEFELDHTFMVPLHFLTPKLPVPIVPIFIAGIAPPLPRSQRCHALGQMVREAVQSWPERQRVAVLGSGSFSLDIGGTKGTPGQMNGFPDPEWLRTVLDCLDRADVGGLVEKATAEQIDRAGNVAGEILNWIAMLGAVGDRRPTLLEGQPGRGDAFAAWRLD